MKTVYIMVEGPTEEEFVNNSVAYYLKEFGIVNAVPIPLETSLGFYGGDVTFARYLTNAQNLLISDPHCIVTSLIDFYDLRTDLPGYTDGMAKPYRPDSVVHIEQEIYNTIGNDNFIPYIQLHEFEGLLFSDIRGFQTWFPTFVNHFQYVINHYNNPELINDGPDTAPSKRIESIVGKRKYKKKLHGALIALENGMAPVLAKCPRFKNWIDTIILKATS